MILVRFVFLCFHFVVGRKIGSNERKKQASNQPTKLIICVCMWTHAQYKLHWNEKRGGKRQRPKQSHMYRYVTMSWNWDYSVVRARDRTQLFGFFELRHMHDGHNGNNGNSKQWIFTKQQLFSFGHLHPLRLVCVCVLSRVVPYFSGFRIFYYRSLFCLSLYVCVGVCSCFLPQFRFIWVTWFFLSSSFRFHFSFLFLVQFRFFFPLDHSHQICARSSIGIGVCLSNKNSNPLRLFLRSLIYPSAVCTYFGYGIYFIDENLRRRERVIMFVRQ